MGKPASMEQEPHHHQLMIVHDDYEEVEDVALKRTLPHSKDNNLVTSVVVSSSSSNGSGHGDGVCTVVTDPDGFPLQKEEEVAEIGNAGEESIHFDGDREDGAAVGLGLVAEFVEAAINGEAITGGATFGAAHVSQNNKNSVYFDTQQGTLTSLVPLSLCLSCCLVLPYSILIGRNDHFLD